MFNRCGGCRVRGRGAAVLNTVVVDVVVAVVTL
jgi:hypothetical protein